ncbi:transcriptional regulator Brz [Haloplanus pelagicus]|uniref:transcriptional regulator Brz n=1 Tax=Haloplanus pelagicus TaxID=2949995 RepID=UPI00273A6D0D|nr:transcriptional regulator Brz [Haloplanus sp. HW8-1]
MGADSPRTEECLSGIESCPQTVPITECQCPRCGSEVRMGLPRAATVKSITAEDRPEAGNHRWKVRSIACQNGHEFFVLFEW